MATRTTKPKRDDDLLANWESIPERAPSIVKADPPTFTRALAMVSLLLTAIGGIALVAPNFGLRYVIAPGWGFFFSLLGVGGLLYHAFREQDAQFRKLYGGLGLLLIVVAIALRILPIGGGLGRLFLPYGVPSLGVALVLLLAVIRNEQEPAWRNLLLLVLAAIGALQIAAGIVGGLISQSFLLGEGIVLMLLGLLYVTSFIGMQSINSPVGYRAGQTLGTVGIVLFILGLLRSILPQLLYRFGFREAAPTEGYFIPAGLTLMSIGGLYALVSLGICSDHPLIVMTRRELAAFFYSPIAYLVLFAWTCITWYSYWFWVSNLIRMMEGARGFGPGGSVPEPIVRYAFFSLVPVIGLIFVVPILTMRLISEEKRSGTLEVLLTAPVNETSIVLSKFFAAFIFYLLTWTPWFLFLVAFRVIGGEAFDFRPVMSFVLALIATGAGLIAMGVFCSSVTKNQIVAAVFAFIGMLAHLAIYFIHHMVAQGGVWGEVINHVSMYDLWDDSLGGFVTPRYLFVHLSIALMFLFLTVKVLAARKWT